MSTQKTPPLWIFILFPAVTMLLGWGLRGFIGGGPFGAMIPGAFVALSLSLMLGHRLPTAAIAALFGAIAIGHGGNMTYGFTLGHACDAETWAWGLLGVTIKGGVWGLLGGPILAAGLIANRYKRSDIVIALLLAIVAFFLGIFLVNQPRYLDFSTRDGESRGESWAGLLFAAIAFVSYLRARYNDERGALPLRFMGWGGLGGALGFGLGTLWLMHGPQTKWIGWWKMMEFSFGFLFGAFLGLAAYRSRDALLETDDGGQPTTDWKAIVPIIALVLIEFAILPALFQAMRAGRGDGDPSIAIWIPMILFGLIGNFVVFGNLCIAFAMRSIPAALQVAITLTFFHTAYDVVGDKMGEDGLAWSWTALWPIILAPTVLIALATIKVSQMSNPVPKLFLLVVWSCYASACLMTYFHLKPTKPGAAYADDVVALIVADPSPLVIHGIFTASAIGATLFTLPYLRSNESSPAPA